MNRCVRTARGVRFVRTVRLWLRSSQGRMAGMATAPAPPAVGQQVVLTGQSWQTYLRLLRAFDGVRAKAAGSP